MRGQGPGEDAPASGNPYRAPTAAVGAPADRATLPIEPAGRWRRLFNLLIDWVACWLLATIGAFLYVVWFFARNPSAEVMPLEQGNLLLDYGLGIAVMLLYYIPLEGAFGCTLGKLATGTRVVAEDGGPPSWGQVVGRTFARMIPFEPLSLLFADDGKVRGWHDALPRTWVVLRR